MTQATTQQATVTITRIIDTSKYDYLFDAYPLWRVQEVTYAAAYYDGIIDCDELLQAAEEGHLSKLHVREIIANR